MAPLLDACTANQYRNGILLLHLTPFTTRDEDLQKSCVMGTMVRQNCRMKAGKQICLGFGFVMDHRQVHSREEPLPFQSGESLGADDAEQLVVTTRRRYEVSCTQVGVC